MFQIGHPGFTGLLRSGGLGLLARSMSVSGLSRIWLSKLRQANRQGYIRAVSYHDTPAGDATNFRKHLALYRKQFCPVTLMDLNQFFETGTWHKDKPGLIISFDDGIRSNYEIAKPLLEEFGFCGWFFIPTDFIDAPPAEQTTFASENRININSEAAKNGAVAMSWEEIKQLDEYHVVGCHTKSHCRFNKGLSIDRLKTEVVQSRTRLEHVLGHPTQTFCWVGGEKESYSAEGMRAITDARYSFAFMTVSDVITAKTNPLCLQRCNVEASWPLWAVRFQIGGLLDRLYASKRRSVLKIVTNGGQDSQL